MRCTSSFEKAILFREKRCGNKIPIRQTEKLTRTSVLCTVWSSYVLSLPLENASFQDSHVHVGRKKNRDCPPFISAHFRI